MPVEEWTPASLRALAEAPFAAWDAVSASVDGALAPELIALIRAEVGASLGVAEPPVSRDQDHALRALVDQFVVDVGSVTDAQRLAAFAALGDQAFSFMQVLYVSDLDVRMREAWRRLFGTNVHPGAAGEGTDLWSALEAFMRAVARMQELDPLTSELVRLRGARMHHCRVCQSRRSVQAARAGADESIYDQIDRFESSALPERQKTALRLVDAMVWQPLNYPGELAGEVHAAFSPGPIVEIVLDVVRNAANKIAVAFGADAPNVVDGIEFYDIDERGEVIFGLTPTL